MRIRKIGIITKPGQPEGAQVASDLVSWCRGQGVEVLVLTTLASEIGQPERGVAEEALASESELLVVIGGDGTLLAAARLLEGRPVPILAVNHGGLGFMTEVMLPELYPELEKVLDGAFTIDRRVMLDAKLLRSGKTVGTHRGLNDVVINKGTLARIIELEARVNDQYVSTFRADGLIIATPTGSTAYNMSAGGAIVHPDMSAILMTPICSHTLTNRPVVLPGDACVVVTLKSTSHDGVYMTVDGQVGVKMATGDSLEVRSSSEEVLLVSPQGKNYFDVLRDKLKWG